MTAAETATLNATARVRQMIDLTERLTGRLADEAAAFETRRPQDVAATVSQTQDLANAYRRESARIKAAPSELAPAPVEERRRLIAATQAFETVLSRHALAVEAARVISEAWSGPSPQRWPSSVAHHPPMEPRAEPMPPTVAPSPSMLKPSHNSRLSLFVDGSFRSCGY